MTALRRTSIGDHHISEAWSLQELQEAVNASRLRDPSEPEMTSAAKENHMQDSNMPVHSVAGSDSCGGEGDSMPRALQVMRRVWEKWTSRTR